MKTHSGVRTVFSRLAKDEPRIDPAFVQFLANPYDLKSLADYANEPALKIYREEAEATIETADRFIASIAGLIE